MRILPEPVEFEWDDGNKEKSFTKHSISNQGCEDVFAVNRFLLLKDAAHSIMEDRYIALGPNKQDKILKLIITLRRSRIRVISARPASKKERQFYEKTFKNSKI